MTIPHLGTKLSSNFCQIFEGVFVIGRSNNCIIWPNTFLANFKHHIISSNFLICV